MTKHKSYVYILSSQRNGTLYTGVTSNLERRVRQHKTGHYDSFTLKYSIKNLVYYEEYDDINLAIAREKQIKKWNRKWKLELIEKVNQNWKDLSLNWIPGQAGNDVTTRLITSPSSFNVIPTKAGIQ